MEVFDSSYSNSKTFEDTLHLISVRLRIDYENSNKGKINCELHGSNEISSYCSQCRKKLCTKCEKSHDKHVLIDKNHIVLEKIDKISSLIEKFCNIKSDIIDVISQCDKQRNSIFKDQKTSLDNIDSVFADLHREIENLKSELLQELQQVVESCLNRLDANKVELVALHDDVSSIAELVAREKSAFQYHDLFELEEYTIQKLNHYNTTMPLDHLRPNELNIQVKWAGTVKSVIKQPLGKINCLLSPEKLSHVRTVSIHHTSDRHKSYITSVCSDPQRNYLYLCDSANHIIKIVVLDKDYSIERCFSGTGKHKLQSPTTIMCAPPSPSSDHTILIVSDPPSQNVVTFDHTGQGIDLFVTNGTSGSMCSIGDLNDLSNLQESSLELSPIYTSMDNNDDSQQLELDQQAIVLCTKSDSLYLEFIQINPRTLRLYKSRPDLGLSFIDSNNSIFPKSIAWNSFSKYIFLLDSKEHKVLIFSSQDGRFIRYYGRFGAANEEFNEPSSIVVDKDGLVLISDLYNDRIHVLDSLGNFVKFLFPFTHRYPISRPTAMCFDNYNNLIICEMDGKMKIYTY